MKYFNLFFIILLLGIIISCSKDQPLPVKEVCQLDVMDQEIVIDINANYAHVFNSANPEIQESNLDSLINYIGDAHFVGLGESSHGTSEFFQMKDKIFRNLVTKKNFKAIIFEIPWGNAFRVNEYVTEGKGSVDEAINQTVYWVYDTEEVRSCAKWIYEQNLLRSEEDQIFFVGCDVQGDDFEVELDLVKTYLSKVVPDSVNFHYGNYAFLPIDMQNYSSASDEVHSLNISGTQKVYDFMEASKVRFVHATSEFEYEVALMATHVIKEREFVYRTNGYGEPRDYLMSFYSEWWQRILSDDAKVAIWAHNAHVSDARSVNVNFMGSYLKANHDLDYKTVGFSFGKGSLSAFVANADRSFLSNVTAQHILEVPCNTTNYLLSEVEGNQHYLIFDNLTGRSSDYFHTNHSFLQMGAGFNPSFINNYISVTSLADFYDVLIHFDDTVASQLK